MPIGPADPGRSFSSAQLLPAGRAAAAGAGVTRLAELTHLDRFGLPVWQAVRPMSRALSVHQGKGACDADAQLGALLEAVESHHAETFDGEGPVCRFDALPASTRAPDIADYARTRDAPPLDADIRWVEAADPIAGTPFHLPFDLVSLDLTRAVPSRFERASNGVATGATRDEAIAVALHELIERDAIGAWRVRGLLACTLDGLKLDSVPFAWLRHWRAQAEEAGASIRCYRVPSISGTPVFACEINDHGKDGAPYRATHGSGCHARPEIALFKAVAEAIQSRATFIAGSREDFLPSAYALATAGTANVAFGLPLPPGSAGVTWDDIAPGPEGVEAIAAALAREGYDRIACVELGAPPGLYVVRAFVPGLGTLRRSRRTP